VRSAGRRLEDCTEMVRFAARKPLKARPDIRARPASSCCVPRLRN
jgi:hypothetical protein